MKIKSIIKKKLNNLRIWNVAKHKNNIGRFQINKLRNYINNFKGKKFLDFGCGFGEECAQASELGLEVFAYDINLNPEMEYVKNIYPSIRLKIGALESIDNKKFDIIHSHHVLEHSQSDIEMLKFFRKNIKDDGIILLAVPQILNLMTLSKRFWNGGNKFSDKTHLREYTFEEIKFKLVHSGFKIVDYYTSGIGIPIIGWGLLSRLIDPQRKIERWIPNFFYIHDSLNFVCIPDKITNS